MWICPTKKLLFDSLFIIHNDSATYYMVGVFLTSYEHFSPAYRQLCMICQALIWLTTFSKTVSHEMLNNLQRERRILELSLSCYIKKKKKQQQQKTDFRFCESS